LPSGIVRFFEENAASEVFTGDAKLGDTPVDTPVELRIGKAIDVGLTVDNQGEEPAMNPLVLLTHRVYLPLELRISNAKPKSIIMEIRQGPLEDLEDMRVKGASMAPQRKGGDYMWRLTVPANGEALLSYKVGGKTPRDN
jgi:hypothetical protein